MRYMKGILPAVMAAAIIGTSSAIAATVMGDKSFEMDLADRCAALQQQFDRIYPEHDSKPIANEARSMYEEGAAECANGDYSRGFASLYRAVSALGVRPDSASS